MAASQYLMLRSIIIAYKYFMHNREILPLSDAVVPLNSVEYSYGFGVYETLRIINGVVLFKDDHIKRLLDSAKVIGLNHEFSSENIIKSIHDLVNKNSVLTSNLKILLIGGNEHKPADLYMICLNPLFVDRKLYRDGVKCVTNSYERAFPNAKTLNMLQSYIAFSKAKKVGAYDALAINHDGFITEGTRTNFFTIIGKTIYSPPESEILPGVTSKHVLNVAKEIGFMLEHKNIDPSELANFDGAFLTSTSTKIMPIKQIDRHSWQIITPSIYELMNKFDEYIKLKISS